MHVLAIEELSAPYDYVVSENEVRDVLDLIDEGDDTRMISARTNLSEAHSILGLRGLWKEVWKDVNPSEYLEELRGEWDARG